MDAYIQICIRRTYMIESKDELSGLRLKGIFGYDKMTVGQERI